MASGARNPINVSIVGNGLARGDGRIFFIRPGIPFPIAGRGSTVTLFNSPRSPVPAADLDRARRFYEETLGFLPATSSRGASSRNGRGHPLRRVPRMGNVAHQVVGSLERRKGRLHGQ